MSPDASDDPTPRDSGANPSTQVDQSASGGSADYSSRGDFGSGRRQMAPGDREAFERRGGFLSGERRQSGDRACMEFKGEGPYGTHRGFYPSNRPDSREKPFGYGRERQEGYGRMGQADSRFPGRYGGSGFPEDYSRFPSDGRDKFGGYSRQYGHEGQQLYRQGQYECGDRPYGYDRNRHVDYYGRGQHPRSSHYGSYTGDRYGATPPFPSSSHSRYPHSTSYNKHF